MPVETAEATYKKRQKIKEITVSIAAKHHIRNMRRLIFQR